MGRRRSSRSRNRSSSRPSHLSTDHPAMLTLCCPFSRPCDYPAVALSRLFDSAISNKLWASFNRSWIFTLKVPNSACPKTRRDVHRADRAMLMICEAIAKGKRAFLKVNKEAAINTLTLLRSVIELPTSDTYSVLTIQEYNIINVWSQGLKKESWECRQKVLRGKLCFKSTYEE